MFRITYWIPFLSICCSWAQQNTSQGKQFTVTVWIKNPTNKQIILDITPISLNLRRAVPDQRKLVLNEQNNGALKIALETPSTIKLMNIWPDSNVSYIAIPGVNLSIHLDGSRNDTTNYDDCGPKETAFYINIREQCRERLRNIPQQNSQLYLSTWSRQLDEMQEMVKAYGSLGISPLYTAWISQSVQSLFQSELCRQLVTYVTITRTWPVNFKEYTAKVPSFSEAQFNQPALFCRETDKELAEPYYLFHSLKDYYSRGIPAPDFETTYRAAIKYANLVKAESSRSLMLRYVCSTAIAHTTDNSFLKWMNTAVVFANQTQHLKKMIADKQTLLRKIGKEKPAPHFEAYDISGKPFSYDNYRGKYLFIDIWATWCVPCRKEIPYLEQLKKKYAGKPIEFVSISTDNNPGAWKKYMESADAEDQFHSLPGKPTSVSEVYSAALIPTFILIDPQGKIVNPTIFRPSDPALTFLVDQLIQKNSIQSSQ